MKIYITRLTLCIYLWCNAALMWAFACGDTPPTYLSFVENKGQWDSQISYVAELNGARLYAEPNRLTYLLVSPADRETLHQAHHLQTSLPTDWAMHYHAFRVNFLGANTVQPTATCQQPNYHNYYLGNDPNRWASHVGLFNETYYTNLFNGIDLRLYGDGGQMKYDYRVAPFANIADIKMQYEGADAIFVQENNLHIQTSVNTMIDAMPIAYQYVAGQMTEIACRFTITNDNEVGFQLLGSYDPSLELIIDPTIVFSTYTGSTTDNWGFTATYDNEGHLYAGGEVFFGAGYPTTVGAFQLDFAGGEELAYGPSDIGITKYSPDGSSLIYSTYLGGNRNEIPESLIVDNDGNLLVLGASGSNSFPTTFGAFDPTYNGGNSVTINSIQFSFGSDLIVTKFNADGSAIIASTYLGGIANDGLNTAAGMKYNYADEGRGEIQIDQFNNVYVVSTTQSPDFPTTDGTVQPEWVANQDGVLCKLNPNLTAMIWGTYLGGGENDAAYSVKIDNIGYLYACGGTTSTDFPATAGTLDQSYNGGSADGWVARISPDGSELSASYLGNNSYDQAYFLDIDDEQNVYVTGQTTGGGYPIFPAGTYNNANSGNFIHKLTNDLSTTLFSTVVGNGSGFPNLSPSAFLVDQCNKIYLSGWGGNVNGAAPGSTTTGMPITADAFQSGTDGSDFYFLILNPNASSIHYGTYFGANGGTGEHVDGGTSRFDKQGRIYQAVCAGCGGSDNFPTTPGAWSQTNNSNNCNLGSIKFDFETAPTVADFVQPAPGCAPYAISFNNLSINAADYVWNFGDGSPVSIATNPSHTYTQAGTYEVSLIAIQPGTCNGSDTLTKVIIIDEIQNIAIQPASACVSAAPFALNANPAGGTWSGTNLSAAGIFTPGNLAAGSYNFSYTIGSDIPGCSSTLSSSVTLIALPQATVVVPAAYTGDGSGSFTATIVVNGSDNSYTLSGDFAGTATNNQNTVVTFNYDGSDFYTINVVGNTNGCATTLSLAPPLCDPSAGTMPTEQQIVCSNGTVSAQTLGEILEPDMVLGYIIHNTPNPVAGNVLAANASGTFVFADLAGGQYNTTYYISAVVGFAGANGLPLLNDPCTRINAGTPVVFLRPISFMINENCDWELTGDYTVVAMPMGGLPQYVAGETYLLSGDANELLVFGETVSLIFPSDQTPNVYSFMAADELGCEGSISNSFPLCIKTPIELVNFSGKVLPIGNEIRWTSATETDNRYFVLERAAANNAQFSPIAQIDSKVQNSSTPTDYTFTDRNAPLGTAYYRLKWVDLNGKIEQSGSIVLTRYAQSTAVSITPNPANAVLQVSVADLTAGEAVTLSVVDVTGRTLSNHYYSAQSGNNDWTVPVADLSSGLYLLRVRTDQYETVYKWLKN